MIDGAIAAAMKMLEAAATARDRPRMSQRPAFIRKRCADLKAGTLGWQVCDP
jgi:hypothetical protein